MSQPDPIRPEITQEITATFQQFQAILKVRDFEAFRRLVSPEFAYTENGETLTLQQLIDREQQASKGQPVSDIHWEIVDIQLADGIATVQVEGDFTTHINIDGTRHVYAGKLSETAQLTKNEAHQWIFIAANLQVQQMTLDGQIVDAAMLNQMHLDAS
ncbi:MAG: nuclear transport factor 2 family protein [Cyanobacteria bacterium P01_D01_bin.44]